jgi:hypothetical protein
MGMQVYVFSLFPHSVHNRKHLYYSEEKGGYEQNFTKIPLILYITHNPVCMFFYDGR